MGQVPINVTGVIACNQFIVASLTDPPLGQPLPDAMDASASQRVVAISLASKESAAPGEVMAFVFFGLPGIARLLQVRPCAFAEPFSCWLACCRLHDSAIITVS